MSRNTTKSQQHYEVIVIGGGIMGSATTYYLSKVLGSQVLQLEQFEFGHKKGSSHGESRLLRKTYPEPHFASLMKDSYDLWMEAQSAYGQQVYTQIGNLDVGPTYHPDLLAIVASAIQYDLKVEVLSSSQMNHRFPMFKLPEGMMGVYSADAGLFAANDCLAMFHTLSRQNGAVLKGGSRVVSIDPAAKRTQDGVTSLKLETGESFSCKWLIITGGAWVNKLLGKVDPRLQVPCTPVEATTGYWPITNPTSHFHKTCPFILNYGQPNLGVFPMFERDGYVKCATFHGLVSDPVDPDRRNLEQLDQKALAGMQSFLEGHVVGIEPVVGPASMDHCMYTLTPDLSFIIDSLPGHEKILVGAGFSGHGFKLAPVVGKILSSLVMTGVHPYPHTEPYFKIDRFNTNNNNPKEFEVKKSLLKSML